MKTTIKSTVDLNALLTKLETSKKDVERCVRVHRSTVEDNDWRDFNFYHTRKPCIVCKKVGDNGMEPRFGYVICEKHKDIPPIEISKYASNSEIPR